LQLVVTKAPLKLNFAGGETDIPSFYRDHGPGVVFTTGIKKYVYVVVSSSPGAAFGKGQATASNQEFRLSYPGLTGVYRSLSSIEHSLTREALRLTGVEQGLAVSSYSDVPAGSGLGSSSSFLVALLLALHTLRGEDPSPEQLAIEAFEANRAAGEPGGKQDPYVAAYGGTGLFKFNGDESVEFKPLPLPGRSLREFEDNMLLCSTGEERRSGEVQASQEAAVEAHLEDFLRMRELALEGFSLASREDFDGLARVADEYWKVRKRVEPSVADPVIDGVYEEGMRAGATGGRLEGAGGGGFMLFFVKPANREKLKAALGWSRLIDVRLEPRGARVVARDWGRGRRSSRVAASLRSIADAPINSWWALFGLAPPTPFPSGPYSSKKGMTSSTLLASPGCRPTLSKATSFKPSEGKLFNALA